MGLVACSNQNFIFFPQHKLGIESWTIVMDSNAILPAPLSWYMGPICFVVVYKLHLFSVLRDAILEDATGLHAHTAISVIVFMQM